MEFKSTKSDPQKQAATTGTVDGKRIYDIYKDGIKKFKFSEGTNNIRLLPQRSDSPFNNYLKIDVLAMYESDKVNGKIRVDPSRDGYISRARTLIKAHPKFKFLMWSPENPNGISFQIKPKVLFLGFSVDEDDKAVKLIELPGTLDYPTRDGKARTPQAGTKISTFVYETDYKGNLKHGDIFDVSTGRVVSVAVSAAGTRMVKYDPSVDQVYDISQDADILKQIVPFSEFIKEVDEAALKEALALYLPKEVNDYLTTTLV